MSGHLVTGISARDLQDTSHHLSRLFKPKGLFTPDLCYSVDLCPF